MAVLGPLKLELIKTKARKKTGGVKKKNQT